VNKSVVVGGHVTGVVRYLGSTRRREKNSMFDVPG
jgi:hypothetical protein